MSRIPAFPPNAGWRDDDPNCRGMMLRDYFAAKAMNGFISHSPQSWDAEEIAAYAYTMADAMIKHRSET